MPKYVIAIDSGTTSTKCLIFEENGNLAVQAGRPIEQIYPHPGWVEHDARETMRLVGQTIWECLSAVESEDCVSIGITNQRESVIVWEKDTGMPIYNEIVWQDHRTAEYCEGLIRSGKSLMIQKKTGLKIDAYFSASKLKWILDNVEGSRIRAERGELLFGTVDCWILWNLTKGRIHATDVTNASRTMLYNINDMRWDDELLELFGIPKCMLPEVHPSIFDYGPSAFTGLSDKVHITGIIGDQQSALFGQTCFDKGDVKITLGTGGFLLINIGDRPVTSKSGLLTTVAWGTEDHTDYALEGSYYIAGAVTQWLTDELCLDVDVKDLESLAESVPDTNGCCLVPAFTGMGAPYWVQNATGALFGITRGVNQAHLVRSALESIVFQANDIIESMAKDGDVELNAIKIDGGVSKNAFVCQFMADITGLTVERTTTAEATALGAAYASGLKSGVWEGTDDLCLMHYIKDRFTPKMPKEEREKNIRRWKKAVECVIYMADSE